MQRLMPAFLGWRGSHCAMNDDTRVLTIAHGSPVAVTVGKDVTEPSTLIGLVQLGAAVLVI